MFNNKRFAFSGSHSTGRFIFFSLLPALLLIAVFTFYPMLKGIRMAFQNYSLFDLSDVRYIGLENFRTIFSDPKFYSSMKNTFFWVFTSLIAQFGIGFVLALLLRKKFVGKGVYQGLIFYSWALSGFLIGIIWRWMFNAQIGVINDLLLKLGIIKERIGFLSDPDWAMVSVIISNIWYGVAFFAIMLLAAMQSIPEELYEAADIDGANGWYKLWHVTVPSIMPTMIITIALRAIWIFNFPDLIYSMTNGGPAGSTHILTSYMMSRIIFDGEYGEASAVGIVCILIYSCLLCFICSLRVLKRRVIFK